MAITYPGVATKSGDNNTYVACVQERLNQLNYDLGNTGVDGLYGSYTESAIQKFQNSCGLSVSGIVDEKTWNALFSVVTANSVEEMVDFTGFGRNSTLIASMSRNVQTVEPVIEKEYNSLQINSYVQHLATQESMPFPVNPTELTEQVSSSWSTTSIPGRSSQFYHYSETPNRQISFSFKLHVDLGEIIVLSQNGSSKSGIDIEDFTYFMQSLCYPVYTGSGVKPPVCKLVIEDVINTRVIFQSVSITKSGPMRKYVGGTHNGKTNYVMYDCNFSIIELPTRLLNANTVKRGWK